MYFFPRLSRACRVNGSSGWHFTFKFLKPITGSIKPEFARKKVRRTASSPTTVTGANIPIIVKKPKSRRSIALDFGVTAGRYWPIHASCRGTYFYPAVRPNTIFCRLRSCVTPNPSFLIPSSAPVQACPCPRDKGLSRPALPHPLPEQRLMLHQPGVEPARRHQPHATVFKAHGA
jgi:hypothetical protein